MQGSAAEFLTPKNIQVDEQGENHVKVVLEPFERGFGHTLGNALRRILLSSMPGAAITEVTIDGVQHEYSTIEGIQEDVVDILLNLKGVSVTMHEREEATLTLNKKGSGLVTAGDIELDHEVEIANPDHVIANLNTKGKLNMTIKVEKGRGYEPAEIRTPEGETSPIGVVAAGCDLQPDPSRSLQR